MKKSPSQMLARWVRGILAVAYYLTFVICAVRLMDAMHADGGPPGQVLLIASAALIFVGWIAIIAIHEAGHALAAWSLGWHVPLVSVRGLTVWPAEGRIHYGLRAFPQLNGGVFVVPRQWENFRIESVIIYCGGGVANLVFAIALASISNWIITGFWAAFCAVVALLSVITGFLNLLPDVWGRANDGLHIREALRNTNPKYRQREFQLVEQFLKGSRPREWDAMFVAACESDVLANTATAAVDLALFSWHLDRSDHSGARAALDRAEAKLGAKDFEVLTSKAFLLAYSDRDEPAARAVLDKIRLKRFRESLEYCLASAAIECAAGDMVALDGALHRARLAFRNSPFKSPAVLEYLLEFEAFLAASRVPVGVNASS